MVIVSHPFSKTSKSEGSKRGLLFSRGSDPPIPSSPKSGNEDERTVGDEGGARDWKEGSSSSIECTAPNKLRDRLSGGLSADGAFRNSGSSQSSDSSPRSRSFTFKTGGSGSSKSSSDSPHLERTGSDRLECTAADNGLADSQSSSFSSTVSNDKDRLRAEYGGESKFAGPWMPIDNIRRSPSFSEFISPG